MLVWVQNFYFFFPTGLAHIIRMIFNNNSVVMVMLYFKFIKEIMNIYSKN